MRIFAAVFLLHSCIAHANMQSKLQLFTGGGGAGTYPSHQRCCAATASRSGETQGDASPPPVRTAPAPTRLFSVGSPIRMSTMKGVCWIRETQSKSEIPRLLQQLEQDYAPSTPGLTRSAH